MDGWWSRGGACARLTCCSPWRRRSGRSRVVKQFVSALLPFSLPRGVQVRCATKHTGKPQRTVLRLPCFAMWSCRRRSPVVLQWLVSAVGRRTVGVGIKLIKLCLREGVGRLELPVSFWGFTACLMTSGGVLTFSGSKRPLPIQVGPHVLASGTNQVLGRGLPGPRAPQPTAFPCAIPGILWLFGRGCTTQQEHLISLLCIDQICHRWPLRI